MLIFLKVYLANLLYCNKENATYGFEFTMYAAISTWITTSLKIGKRCTPPRLRTDHTPELLSIYGDLKVFKISYSL